MMPRFSRSDHFLLLGCTGLFGKEILNRFFQAFIAGDQLPKITLVTRSIDRTLSRYPELKSIASLVEIDFSTSSSLSIDTAPTHILHMANTSAYDTFHGANQFSKYLLLLNSSLAIKSLLDQFRTVRRVLFTSSGVAYGPGSDYMETSLPKVNPSDVSMSLAFGKLTSEFVLSSAITRSSASLCIARCFSFISPWLPTDLHYALGSFVSKAVVNEEIVITSDGSDLRSYQHISDTVDWLLQLLTLPNVPHLINVGSDRSISILELAKLVVKILDSGSKISVLNISNPTDNFRRNCYIPSLSTANSLGLTNSIELEQGILELAQHLRASL